jgi:hypothetical protein
MKTPKAKKPFQISLDTKKVDVNIKRDENGKVTVDIDTPKADIHIEKSEEGTKAVLDFDDTDEVDFVANGKGRHLPKGTVWRIAGAMARTFLKLGLGEVKRKIKK